MSELINLRNARKRARRQKDEALAQGNRRLHGQPKHSRRLAEAQRAKADHELEGHRIERNEQGDAR